MIKTILDSPIFREKPPVLLDLGASGFIHKKWREIAPYSYCVAFDADTRKFGHSVSENSGFKKIFTVHKIVTDQLVDETDFYLTKSPYCSSALEPEWDKLSDWGFQSKFEVVEKIKLPATTIKKAISEIGIDYIDWFKSDTQGTDLRLFNSLENELIDKVLIAEFEPGYIDAYKGEDKMLTVLTQMKNDARFWLAGMTVKGAQRISSKNFTALSPLQQKFLQLHVKQTPGWAELTFAKTATSMEKLSLREFLLLYVFALIEKQYGFALELFQEAKKHHNDKLIDEGIRYAQGKLNIGIFGLPKAFFTYIRLKKNR